MHQYCGQEDFCNPIPSFKGEVEEETFELLIHFLVIRGIHDYHKDLFYYPRMTIQCHFRENSFLCHIHCMKEQFSDKWVKLSGMTNSAKVKEFKIYIFLFCFVF